MIRHESINPLDYTKLAWKHVYASNKRGFRGVDDEDMFQSAMEGILLAIKSFDESRGVKFETFAYWYIQREINSLFYRNTTVGHKETKKGILVSKTQDILYADMPASEGSPTSSHEDCSVLSHEEDVDSEIWVEEYLSSLKLNSIENEYFYDMIVHGDQDASANYQVKTGNTRSRSMQVKQRVRQKARRHLDSINRFG